MAHAHDHDFHIPGNNIWSPLSCLGAGIMVFGLVALLHAEGFGISEMVGQVMMGGGLLLTVFSAMKWWLTLIQESRERGFSSVPTVLELANRYGMIMFIASEVMFFAAFFAGFFYLRSFQSVWPPENIETLHITLPTINTLLLLTSGATITWAHHALLKGNMAVTRRATMYTWMIGVLFLGLQAYEYGHAAFAMDSGVYGSTFYLLTGFHGFHVFVGSVMLMVLSRRLSKGDFSTKHHFYFEGTAWYWHFVDVVWVGLYLFVYFL